MNQIVDGPPHSPPSDSSTEGLGALAEHSRFVQRINRRYAKEMALLPAGLPEPSGLLTCLQALRSQHDLAASLRILRQLVVERLCQLDCSGRATMPEITRVVTELAELCQDLAMQDAQQVLDERHGMPLRQDGQRSELWCVGMGKLGARELNVSSDIDLIYLYQEDGQTEGLADGRGVTANSEYFAKMIRMVSQTLADVTEHGFVFRVDLALRPNGNSGASATSLAALEEYFQVQGREWERFAWMKSRVIAPRAAIASGSPKELGSIVLPFVFRRYLDYAVFESLRSLHQQIRSHAAKRAAGHPERANDVKLSRGGIREIEFIVQLLQVVRGGQFPELRERATLNALPKLSKAGLMPQASAQQLAEAYVFLRNVEHRIQYLDDQQTHILPTDAADLGWLAKTMGFADTAAFLAALAEHRNHVAAEFELLLGNSAPSTSKAAVSPSSQRSAMATPAASADASAASPAQASEWEEWLNDRAKQVALPESLKQRILAWSQGARVRAVRDETRVRLMHLVEKMMAALASGEISEEACERWLDWVEPLLKRESYLALLLERPLVQKRVLALLGAAKWASVFLKRYPGTIDELAQDSMYEERFQREAFIAELESRKAALSRTGEDDEEALLNVLRRAHHGELLRTLARDLEGRLTVEQVADDLSALADSMLEVCSRWVWQRLKPAHRPDPQFAIIGYGKLGGKELGYGSDLDIVFIYQDDDANSMEIYSAFIRKLINWLSVKTAEGDLFEIDTELRPNGNSGLLVTSFAAYEKYQTQSGDNSAWTWELQALTRARFVIGSEHLRLPFERLRLQVLCKERDAVALRDEILAMRERVRAAHPVAAGCFDIKHSVGGMVDAEFAVQYLVLTAARTHPELQGNVGNIALLQNAEQVGLLPVPLGQAAAKGYRQLRALQHHARLNEETTQIPQNTLSESTLQALSAIEQLGKQVFPPIID